MAMMFSTAFSRVRTASNSNSCISVLIICMSLALCTCSSASQINISASFSGLLGCENDVYFSVNGSFGQTVRSQLECASICVNNPKCVSFSTVREGVREVTCYTFESYTTDCNELIHVQGASYFRKINPSNSTAFVGHAASLHPEICNISNSWTLVAEVNASGLFTMSNRSQMASLLNCTPKVRIVYTFGTETRTASALRYILGKTSTSEIYFELPWSLEMDQREKFIFPLLSASGMLIRMQVTPGSLSQSLADQSVSTSIYIQSGNCLNTGTPVLITNLRAGTTAGSASDLVASLRDYPELIIKEDNDSTLFKNIYLTSLSISFPSDNYVATLKRMPGLLLKDLNNSGIVRVPDPSSIFYEYKLYTSEGVAQTLVKHSYSTPFLDPTLTMPTIEWHLDICWRRIYDSQSNLVGLDVINLQNEALFTASGRLFVAFVVGVSNHVRYRQSFEARLVTCIRGISCAAYSSVMLDLAIDEMNSNVTVTDPNHEMAIKASTSDVYVYSVSDPLQPPVKQGIRSVSWFIDTRRWEQIYSWNLIMLTPPATDDLQDAIINGADFLVVLGNVDLVTYEIWPILTARMSPGFIAMESDLIFRTEPLPTACPSEGAQWQMHLEISNNVKPLLYVSFWHSDLFATCRWKDPYWSTSLSRIDIYAQES